MLTIKDPSPPRRVDRHRSTDAAPTVALGLTLTEAERGSLAEALGRGYRVEDIRRAPPDSAVLVIPPCSPHAVERLKRSYPRASLLVVEHDRRTSGGPVADAMRAGVGVYSVGEFDAADLADSVRWLDGAETA